MADNNPEPGPEIDDSDTDFTALSKTIEKLRRELIVERLKRSHIENKYSEVYKEKERLRKLSLKQSNRIARLLAKGVTKTEKRNIVEEILKENNFTQVGHFYSDQITKGNVSNEIDTLIVRLIVRI